MKIQPKYLLTEPIFFPFLMSPKNIYLIAAVDAEFGIGTKDNTLPWKLKGDMTFFHETSTQTQDPKQENAVIMGRNTWESIPEARRPLKYRYNAVLTGNKEYQAEGAEIFHSLDEALKTIQNTRADIETIFIIGGGKVYSEAILRPDITGIYLTYIKKSFNCHVSFPKLPEHFQKYKNLGNVKEGEIAYEYRLYENN